MHLLYLENRPHISTLSQGFGEFIIALSEPAVVVGKPFTIMYQFSFQQMTPIQIIHLKLLYQEVGGEKGSYGDGFSSPVEYPHVQECSLFVHQTNAFLGDPAFPFIQQIQWSIPAYLLPSNPTTHIHTRKNWRLEVLINPRHGSTIQATYSFPILDASIPQEIRAIRAEELVQKGKRDAERYRYEEALNAFVEATRLDHLKAEAHAGRSGILIVYGHHKQALRFVNEALRIKPDYGHAHYNKGLILAALKDYDGARASFDQALRWNARDAWALSAKSALLRMHYKDYDGALSLSLMAIASDSTFALSYIHRCWALIALKRLEEAKEVLAEAKEHGAHPFALFLTQSRLLIKRVLKI